MKQKLSEWKKQYPTLKTTVPDGWAPATWDNVSMTLAEFVAHVNCGVSFN